MFPRSIVAMSLALCACDRGAASAPPARSPAAAHLLAHLPADTVGVASLSLAGLADSTLWRRAVGVVAYEAPAVAAAVVGACSLDPWTIGQAAAIAFTASDDTDVLALTVAPARAELEQCLGRAAAQGGKTVRPEPRGALTGYAQAESTEYVAWHDEHTLLTRPFVLDDPAALHDVLVARAPSPALAALLARVDQTAAAWVVAVPGDSGTLAEMIAAVPLARPPVGLHASLHRGARWSLVIGVQLASAAEVPAAIELARKGLVAFDGLAPWRDDVVVEGHGDEVRLRLELDARRGALLEETLAALLPQPSTARPASAAP